VKFLRERPVSRKIRIRRAVFHAANRQAHRQLWEQVMKGDREGKMNTVEKQCIVHACSRPAIVGTSQSVTLLIRISFLTSKTFSSLYTFRLPVTADVKAVFRVKVPR
jgi:hypothetical protein